MSALYEGTREDANGGGAMTVEDGGYRFSKIRDQGQDVVCFGH
jgi:hypothetical protein